MFTALSSTYLAAPRIYSRNMFDIRLKEAIAYAKKSRGWLAAQIGVSESAITMVLTGKAKSMSAPNCAKAAKALGVSGYWLATGEGEIADPDLLIWRDVARSLATAMDSAERGQRYAVFVQEVDALVERAKLNTKADNPTEQAH